MTIWKFPLTAEDIQHIEAPEINRPLAVQTQNGMPQLWMLVDPESRRRRIKVRTFGTGHPGITQDMDYVGTYQLSGGALVFHVFIESSQRL
jgi:hypothetical protein